MKKTATALLIALIFSVPFASQAQVVTAPVTRESLVQQIIVLLQAQLAILTEQLEMAKLAEKKADDRREERAKNNAKATMPEEASLEIWKLAYEPDTNTLYVRTSEATSGFSVEGLDISKTFERDMDGSCIGSGDSKKCGGFAYRFSLPSDTTPGEYVLTVGDVSETFSVR